MAFVNVEGLIQRAQTTEDLKIALRILAQAVNTLHDTKGQFHSDLQFMEDDKGIILRRTSTNATNGDGGWTKIIATGVGTSVLSQIDLGKTDPSITRR
jgi:hypothetical protein